MHPALLPSLTKNITIAHKTGINGFGEPTTTTVGPLKAWVETSRARIVVPTGETVTAEGLVVVAYESLQMYQVQAGDTITLPDGRSRAIRIIELLNDIDGNPSHYEITF